MESVRATVAELVATFGFVLIAAGAVITSGFGLDLTGVALATGAGLAAFVSITRPLGAGILNPAVSIAWWVAGRISTGRVVAAIAAQLAGAVAAAYVLRYLVPATAFDAASGGASALAPGLATGKAIAIEAVGGFLLAFVYFGTAVDIRGGSSRTEGLAIGLVAAALLMVFGPLTSAAMNPARWFGPALATGTWDDWFVWIAGPVAGGIAAAVFCTALFLRDGPPAVP